jgi:acyl-CoA hydrolase
MGPADANSLGRVHGGVIMRLADEAAGIAAIRHCGRPAVTAGVDRMAFVGPVEIGQLVVVRASLNAAWTTSMEVGVRVEAEDLASGAITHALSAYFTMVALDTDGHPMAVPELVAVSESERQHQQQAQHRRSERLGS